MSLNNRMHGCLMSFYNVLLFYVAAHSHGRLFDITLQRFYDFMSLHKRNHGFVCHYTTPFSLCRCISIRISVLLCPCTTTLAVVFISLYNYAHCYHFLLYNYAHCFMSLYNYMHCFMSLYNHTHCCFMSLLIWIRLLKIISKNDKCYSKAVFFLFRLAYGMIFFIR